MSRIELASSGDPKSYCNSNLETTPV